MGEGYAQCDGVPHADQGRWMREGARLAFFCSGLAVEGVRGSSLGDACLRWALLRWRRDRRSSGAWEGWAFELTRVDEGGVLLFLPFAPRTAGPLLCSSLAPPCCVRDRSALETSAARISPRAAVYHPAIDFVLLSFISLDALNSLPSSYRRLAGTFYKTGTACSGPARPWKHSAVANTFSIARSFGQAFLPFPLSPSSNLRNTLVSGSLNEPFFANTFTARLARGWPSFSPRAFSRPLLVLFAGSCTTRIVLNVTKLCWLDQGGSAGGGRRV